MKVVQELKDTDKGLWQVKTEASSYIIDLDERQFMRNPGEGLGAHPNIKGRIVTVSDLSDLFPDSKWQPLISIGLCEVDNTMMLYASDGLWVRSTLVRSIEQLAEDK